MFGKKLIVKKTSDGVGCVSAKMIVTDFLYFEVLPLFLSFSLDARLNSRGVCKFQLIFEKKKKHDDSLAFCKFSTDHGQ